AQANPSPAASLVQAPPTTVLGILGKLGPGLIIAGSIVGSGELIATTRTGAEAGYWLLWLILVGCVIKVFAQVEMGRYTLVSRQTPMAAMNEVPGPRYIVNWLLWYWLAMFLVSLGQLGGIVGGVGQAMAMSAPITGDFNRLLDAQTEYDLKAKAIRDSLQLAAAPLANSPDLDVDAAASAQAAGTVTSSQAKQKTAADAEVVKQLGERPDGQTRDDLYWAALVTIATSVMLVMGRYGLIEWVTTILVAGFTFVTIFNLIMLQLNPEWAITWDEFSRGFMFSLTPRDEIPGGGSPLATALKTFGIIGVGATELIQYPYWCLEKGYAKFTGPRDDSPEWADRARGWMRVMQWDAWCSCVVYTFATVAFYLLGASILHNAGLVPDGNHLIRSLSKMYETVFGPMADEIFLIGAFAVLYSTFFVANAGHARTSADAMRLWKLGGDDEASRVRWVTIFSGGLPIFCFIVFVFYRNPVQLVLASGMMQAIMLPMLGGATLYFRYRRCDDRLKPGPWWDVCLIVSVLGLLFAGVAMLYLLFLDVAKMFA
ncbi:MAG TPA: Nramp family divalent metal transporter, partial [Pirellulales bacterium]